MIAYAVDSLTKLKNNRVNQYFYALSFGILLNVSSYVGILTLQSSIHFEENIGTISASVLYITAATLSIVLTPFLLLYLGAKWSLIIGETGFLIYTLSNLSSNLGPLIFGGLFGSLGEALIWPAAPVYINFLLKEFWNNLGVFTRPMEKERSIWLGAFYCILQNSTIWGNFLSYLTLFGGRRRQTIKNENNLINDTSDCGSNFHLRDQGTEDAFKYVPENEASIYLMVTVFALLQIFAIFIHYRVLPTVRRDSMENLNPSGYKVISSTMRSIIRHTCTKEHIMLIALNVYNGLLVSYSRSVFTQAFISCTLGVEMVGLVMMTYGCTNALASLAAGQVASRFGVSLLVAFGFLYDIFSYTLQLMWSPTLENRYSVFAIGTMTGVSEGTWQFVTVSITSMYFEERQEVAFGTVNFWAELGVFFGFVLTPVIMVKDRIYLMIIILIIGCIGYTIVEVIRRKNVGNRRRLRSSPIFDTVRKVTLPQTS